MTRPVRLGFLVPPGNPTAEPEMIKLTPPGVTVHFTRMVAHGEAGAHAGQEERNRTREGIAQIVTRDREAKEVRVVTRRAAKLLGERVAVAH